MMPILSWRTFRRKRTNYVMIILTLLAACISAQKAHKDCTTERIKYLRGRVCGAYKRSISSPIPTNDISQHEFSETADLEDGYAEILMNFIRTGANRKKKSRFDKKKYGLKKRKSKRTPEMFDAILAKYCSDPSSETMDFSELADYCI